MHSLKTGTGYGPQLRQWADTLPLKFRKYAKADVVALEQRVPTLEAMKDLATDPHAASRDRARAVWALGVMRPRGVSSLLLNILRNEFRNELVLWEVAKALVKVEPRGAVREAVNLLEHGTPLQRSVSAWTIGVIGGPSTRKVLERTLAQDRSSRVRDHAAEALGTIGTAASTPVLIAATKAAAPDVRFSAAYALGQIGDSRALGALERLVTDRAVTRSGQTVGTAAQTAMKRIRAKVRARIPKTT